MLRRILQTTINSAALVLTSPAILICRLEQYLFPRRQAWFVGFSQFFALFPGFPGVCLRRAFYYGTLRYCSLKSVVGFGSIISKRETVIEDHAYVGNYVQLGCVTLRKGCLIGSKSSILSQGAQHEMDSNGRWITPDRVEYGPTEVGEYAWIGEGVILVANVGKGCLVTAGSVVTSPVPAHTQVGGNPARFIKKLWEPLDSQTPSST